MADLGKYEHELIGIFTGSPDGVYRLDGWVYVRQSHALATLRSWDFEQRPLQLASAPDTAREAIPDLLAQSTDFVQVPLGRLLVWASVRTGKAYTANVHAEYGEPVEIRGNMDPQSCLGAPFNRCLVREALQLFVERRLLATSLISASLVNHNGGCVLVLRHGDDVAMVMSLRPGTETGTERMPTESR